MAKVLVIGQGAREHAIGRQLLLSEQVEEVYCAPGNPGMLRSGIKTVLIKELNFEKLVEFARKQAVSLTVVGPELLLQQGIVDYFNAAGLAIFGPTQAAAKLESSKQFAKKVMQEAGVSTACYASFQDESSAIQALSKVSYPVVIKADGLAAGKGVTIAKNQSDAVAIIHQLLGEHQFNTSSIVIEEYLKGQEFSLMAFVNDDQIIPMPLSQDHKAAYDGDRGPNTGGMGAYSPLPQFPTELGKRCVDAVVRPIIHALRQRDISFCGVLYAGLIMTKTGPKVIEFNVRFGDPETEVVLPQLQSDFYELILGLLDQQPPQVKWQNNDIYLGVVVSSENYPQSSAEGISLSSFNSVPVDLTVNYAGVAQDLKGELVSDGGRILCATTKASNITQARTILYSWLNQQKLVGMRYRNDIGKHGE
ncbi:phosphoribosylamine--glycine ligase [Pediococcus acidilactici]|uniref:phosphoribosylamine--glycine ligase n=1 Tax=Pediococcus acidilactici TaxID=1254 RepID=UPI001CCF3BEA|nr:phosphoribosylamine--glycine ligase [Pediococcus acidilactici]